jgi:hypothetical protein
MSFKRGRNCMFFKRGCDCKWGHNYMFSRCRNCMCFQGGCNCVFIQDVATACFSRGRGCNCKFLNSITTACFLGLSQLQAPRVGIETAWLQGTSQLQVFQVFVAIACPQGGTTTACFLGFLAISCPKGGIATACFPKAGRNFMFSRVVATASTQGWEPKLHVFKACHNCKFSLVCRNYMSLREESQLQVFQGKSQLQVCRFYHNCKVPKAGIKTAHFQGGGLQL